MNRLAVFVKGYTEVKFVMKLIEEIAGQGRVLIEHREIRGGGKTRGSPQDRVDNRPITY